MQFLFWFLLTSVSLFLILLVLVQRGRGGGLTGALGGMGGQSAFGTKAGDTFTRVTIIAASVWIVCAILALKTLSKRGGPLGNANAADTTTVNNTGGSDGDAANTGGGDGGMADILGGLPASVGSADAGAATTGAAGAATAGGGTTGTAGAADAGTAAGVSAESVPTGE